MYRPRPIANVTAALQYYTKADGGYYLGDKELGCMWLGEGAEKLGLDGRPEYEQFERLLKGLDPHTGEQLTKYERDESNIPGWDVTASVPKGVTTLLECGDQRVQQVIRLALELAFEDTQEYATTRVRKGGVDDDRYTQNLVAYAVEHPETRPARQDGLPDWDRHWHLVIFNLTFDPVEQEWKAVKIKPLFDARKYFDRRFDSYVASGMADLGYEIESKHKAEKGAKRYFSWDVKGLPQSVIKKFSRRTQEVEELAQKLKITEPTAKDKLGATSRQRKRDDMTLADYRREWQGRLAPAEKRQIAELIAGARQGRRQSNAEKAVDYALAHHHERNSVQDQGNREVSNMWVTALEKSMGGANPREIDAEFRRRVLLTKKDGPLLQKGQVATTPAVLAQEGRIIDFAREGKGTMRPLISYGGSDGRSLGTFPPDRAKTNPDHATLSAEQQALFDHVMSSTDQVALVVADAGTGKTRTSKPIVAAIQAQTGKHVEMLAPSASASRGTLREEGFSKADTVASFLQSQERQRAVKDGVIWVDEGSLLSINDLEALCGICRRQNARIVLQGDPKQHRSVARDGNMLKVLESYAGLKVGRLTEIWRQQNTAYKRAVALIAKGDILKGHEALENMGAVKREGIDRLVGDYCRAVDSGRTVLLVAPTHQEGDAINEAIRHKLREGGKLGADVTIPVLKPLHWTDAQKGDPHAYSGYEVIQYHRGSGQRRAGERVVADASLFDGGGLRPDHFTVFQPGEISLAPGDDIRITHNSWSKPDAYGHRHRLDNGSLYTVESINGRDITLSNGWVTDTPHLTHGYVSTSYGAQGKTVDVCLAAMGRESVGAINAAQFYVTASRAKHAFRLYTDLGMDELKAVITRCDTRKSATEVFKPKPKRRAKNPHIEIWKRAQEHVRRLLREQQQSGMHPDIMKEQERNVGHER